MIKSNSASICQENALFTEAVKDVFSVAPYVDDPRKTMIQSHLINGHTIVASQAQQVFPYLSKPLSEVCVLDVGCGSGMVSAAFSHLGVREIIGFDLTRHALGLDLAHLRTYNAAASVNFMQADGYHIPLANHSVDLCWCNFVIEHVTSPLKLLKELCRVLSPKGLVYVSTNNRLWPIEPHSGTWFTTWLPCSLAERYVRWRKRWPTWEDWDVYPPTYWQLHLWSQKAGFDVVASTRDLIKSESKKTLQGLKFLGHFEFLFPNLYVLLAKGV